MPEQTEETEKNNTYTQTKLVKQTRKRRRKKKAITGQPILVIFYNTNGNFMLPIHHCNNFHFPIKNQTLKKNCLLKELLIEHYNGHNKLLSTKYE